MNSGYVSMKALFITGIFAIFVILSIHHHVWTFLLGYPISPVFASIINNARVFSNASHVPNLIINYSHNGGFALTYKMISYDSNTKNMVFANIGFGLVNRQEKKISSLDEMRIEQLINNSRFFDLHSDFRSSSCADCHNDNLTIAMNDIKNTVVWTSESHKSLPQGLLNIVDVIMKLCGCDRDMLP